MTEDLDLTRLFEVETVTLRQDGYKHYRKQHPKGTTNNKLYREIAYAFIKAFMEEVFNGSEVMMYGRLGVIAIVGEKVKPFVDEDGNIKGVAPDWGATKKLQATNEEAREKRTIVYCFNEHSNGIKYEFVWGVTDVIAKNRTFYSYTRTWHNRRELVRRIKQEGAEYQVKVDKIENENYAKQEQQEEKEYSNQGD